MAKNPKVIVIGLDGATFDLINPWVKEGKLPNIAKLMKEGCYGNLRSTIPPVSAQAWASFLTGKWPGKHGVFGFVEHRSDGNWTFSDSRSIGIETMWDVLSKNRRKSAFLFVPMTFPPLPMNGFIIAGLGTPSIDSDFTYPKQLKGELIKKYGTEYILEIKPANLSRKEYMKRILKNIEVQTDIVDYMLNKDEFDLFVMVYGQLDRVQHFFWKQMDPNFPGHDPDEDEEIRNAILNTHVKVDRSIGYWVNQFPDSNIIIMSDHGAGPYSTSVYMNNWLQSIGLLTYKKPSATIITMMKKLFLKLGKSIPRKYVLRIKNILPRTIGDRLFSMGINPTAFDIDWDKTLAYSIGIFGNLYTNNTNVDSELKSKIIQKIIDKLYELKGIDNNSAIIGRVYKKEEIFRGPFIQRAPDIVFTFNDDTYFVKPEHKANRKDVFGKTHEYSGLGSEFEYTSNHRMHGILIASGPDVPINGEINNAAIVDLFPTIMRLLGLPVPNDVDGKLLFGNSNKRSTHIIKTFEPACIDNSLINVARDGYSEDDTKTIQDHLKSLGYL